MNIMEPITAADYETEVAEAAEELRTLSTVELITRMEAVRDLALRHSEGIECEFGGEGYTQERTELIGVLAEAASRLRAAYPPNAECPLCRRALTLACDCDRADDTP